MAKLSASDELDSASAAAAKAFPVSETMGFLPGSVLEKMVPYEVHAQLLVRRDNESGVTSNPVKPMQTLRFRPR